ncbi:MAG: SDR family oxidoreductase [Solirubrobacteraceae bacterium]|nr:SDR family oxidoreductase [Solirubrobacteraceae bacterium]
MSAPKPYEAIEVGDRESVRHRVTEDDVRRFVEMTGDDNPLHVDRGYAETTPFKDIVVHGMLGASFLSTVIGTKLPGTGALWVSQSFDFKAPVRLGDDLEISATVTAKHDSQRMLDLDAQITNQRGETLLSGSGRVRVLEPAPAPEPTPGLPPVALVTGGSGGIGRSICTALGRAGLSVIVGFGRDEERAAETVREIEGAGGAARAIGADLTAPGAGADLVAAAERAYGPVGVVVNNASGRITSRPVDELDWADVQAHLDVQVRSAIELVRAAVPGMRAAGAGRVITITSQVVDQPTAGWAGYAMAKSALTSLTMHLAEELGPHGITANCVAPGLTDTRLVGDMPEKARLLAARATPRRRLGAPDDVGAAVAYLASPEAEYVTGQTLRVNGGKVMR